MNRWKLAGELLIPKNMTFGSKRPWRILNAPFHWSSSLMQILLYPHHISNLLNSSIPCKSSIHCARFGRGVTSFLVTAFNGW